MDSAHSPLIHRVADILCRGLESRSRGRVVLDVGCGDGALLHAIHQRGFQPAGIEQVPSVALKECGFSVLRASARHLPFPTSSFDVVVLRHVPHHLEQPGPCIQEAARVARRRLVLAEPWFDTSLPGQAAGLEADRILKAMDRKRGEFHAESLSAAQLLALANPAGATVHAETFLPLRPWQSADLEQRMAAASAGLPHESKPNEAWLRLLELADRGKVSRNGTQVLSIDWA